MHVITADILNSTTLSPDQKLALEKTMKSLKSDSIGIYEYFIRGDSFQIMLPDKGLTEALKIKFALFYQCDIQVRMSIGIGAVANLGPNLSNSEGEAFSLSGRGLDTMKQEMKLLSINSSDEEINEEWQIHCMTLDYLELKLTQNQAEVLYWLIQELTQQEIADKVGISQSAVNRRIKGTAWPIIDQMITRFNHQL